MAAKAVRHGQELGSPCHISVSAATSAEKHNAVFRCKNNWRIQARPNGWARSQCVRRVIRIDLTVSPVPELPMTTNVIEPGDLRSRQGAGPQISPQAQSLIRTAVSKTGMLTKRPHSHRSDMDVDAAAGKAVWQTGTSTHQLCDLITDCGGCVFVYSNGEAAT